MRKVFVPLFASLLLCGAAAAALGVAGAQAQTEAGNPAMAQNTQSPPGSNMGRHRFDPAEMAARFKAHCEDRYAGTVGRMAYLETRLNLTGSQPSLFSAWRSVRLNIARRDADACAKRDFSQMGKDTSPVDRMGRMEDRLKMRVADLDAERPAFAALYNALSPEQQKALTPDHHMHGHHGMMGRGMMGRGHGPMNRQPPAQ